MVQTRNEPQRLFEQEVRRLTAIQIERFHPLDFEFAHIVYRPVFTSVMEEQLMNTFAKEQIKHIAKFGGNSHEDVVKWLHDIDEIFDRAKLQSSNKFIVAQAYLTDSADKWFRNNKSKILDWSTFNMELTKAYKPSINQILFNMEQRHQQAGETVMEYYHDKIYLCSQADPTMNSSMKVHYLLKGLNDLLLPHVIRRHPTTSEEFLTIAQDEEKILFTLNGLSSLSSTSINQPAQYPYPAENLNPHDTINVVNRPTIMNNRTVRPQHHQISHPPPLMTIPTGSFPAPSHYPYSPSRSSSSPTKRQCYSCYGFGHLARSCPNRKNM